MSNEERRARVENENMDIYEWFQIEWNNDKEVFHFYNEHWGYTLNCNPDGD